jgi:hypothetical protein
MNASGNTYRLWREERVNNQFRFFSQAAIDQDKKDATKVRGLYRSAIRDVASYRDPINGGDTNLQNWASRGLSWDECIWRCAREINYHNSSLHSTMIKMDGEVMGWFINSHAGLYVQTWGNWERFKNTAYEIQVEKERQDKGYSTALSNKVFRRWSKTGVQKHFRDVLYMPHPTGDGGFEYRPVFLEEALDIVWRKHENVRTEEIRRHKVYESAAALPRSFADDPKITPLGTLPVGWTVDDVIRAL